MKLEHIILVTACALTLVCYIGYLASQEQAPVVQVPTPIPTPPQFLPPPSLPKPPVIPDERISPNREIDRLFGGFANGPGASVAVIKDGRFVYKNGYGYAKLGEERATAYTNFRLASVSKQFTAGAVMILKDQGKLNFNDPLRRFWPDLPPWADRVTVRHLLTHTSGLPRDGGTLVSGTVTDNKIVEALKRHSGPRSVGQFSYCNVGYCVLAALVEKVSGMPYPQFMKENIFVPLGMENSCIYQDGTSISNRAYGYSGRRLTDQDRGSKTYGDGCVYTSVHEYWAWDQALYDGRLFRPETLKEALTPHRSGYGFGWFIRDGQHSHTGSSIGFRTAVLRYPEKKLTVVVFSNRSGARASSLAYDVARLYR